MTLYVYTDGSSHSRGGKPGGFAWYIIKDGAQMMCGCGGSTSTTNNLMELSAAIQALEAVEKLGTKDPVVLISDSMYVLRLAKRECNAFKNLDVVHRLQTVADKLTLETKWVKGHSGDYWNEECDKLAKKCKQYYTEELNAEKAKEAV